MKITPIIPTLLIAAIGTAASAAEPKVIHSFDSPSELEQVNTNDTEVEFARDGKATYLKVTSGTTSPYPNVRFRPEGNNSATWDLSAFETIEFDVTNLNETSVRLIARVDSEQKGEGREAIGGKLSLAPGESGTVLVNIDREIGAELREQLHGMQATPWGKRGKHGDGIDPSQVREMQLYLAHPKESYTFAIHEIRATGRFDPSSVEVPDPFFPFIDRFGQYIHQDWPGKVKTESDLKQNAEREANEVRESPRPDSWNQYGGWADGPQLEATGHFRTEKVDGAWHLVDPEGRLFFSLGIDCVRDSSATPIDQGRDHWFTDAPWESGDSAMQAFLGEKTARRDDYAKKQVKIFDFYGANLQRKYGDDWRQQWLEKTPARLMNWGINTIGTWSDPELFENTSIPYTHWVHINAAKLPWQKGTRNRISDPFHPNFANEVTRRATNMTRGTTEDPWCIGYFLDNELAWGQGDYLARGLLAAKPDQHAKQEMFKQLEAQYGDIAKLNEAWGVNYASWDDAVKDKSDPQTEQAGQDLMDFNGKIAHAYFATAKRVFKEIAPNKLYLGCRFAEYNPQVAAIAAEYCDVVSFNVYRDTLEGWRPIEVFDAPIIIGEFHFGTNDRGVFNTGLVRADSTQDKADRFKAYVESAVGNPLVVGCHWFQLNDQPATGRSSEGENHGIGFLSITDSPHDAMIEASRDLAKRLYTLND